MEHSLQMEKIDLERERMQNGRSLLLMTVSLFHKFFLPLQSAKKGVVEKTVITFVLIVPDTVFGL